eukprot:SAG31_NODE_544_length_14245_cov_68.376644_5_plen_156_part_00
MRTVAILKCDCFSSTITRSCCDNLFQSDNPSVLILPAPPVGCESRSMLADHLRQLPAYNDSAWERQSSSVNGSIGDLSGQLLSPRTNTVRGQQEGRIRSTFRLIRWYAIAVGLNFCCTVLVFPGLVTRALAVRMAAGGAQGCSSSITHAQQCSEN